MQRKIAVALLLIVLLPVAVLAWLGLRMAHNEQQVASAQVQALITTQLTSVDDAINGYFRQLQEQWLARLASNALDNASLKQWSQESSQVQEVLVIDAEGKRVFPAPTGNFSEAQKQFLQRTSAIWENPSILTQGAPLAGPNGLSSRFSSSASKLDSVVAEASAPQSGWYAWHWNAQLHHIFWWRDAQSRLIGVELAPVALLSEIIARLPATSGDAAQVNSSIRLVNGSGQSVYEWGNYRAGAQEKSLAMLPLSHPLATWKLEYFGPTLAGAAAANSLVVLAAVVSIGAALAGLAAFLYREHNREIRLAQQRVNFVNQVSHELKTPLTNIRLYAELLDAQVEEMFEDDAQRDGAKARKYIGVIAAESQRLSRLIGNVLSFGQIQKSQFKLSLQPGTVDEVIARCIAAFKPALDAKSIRVQFSANAQTVVLLDAQALEQILNNLFSNAEKYAASGGALEIESQQGDGVSTIDVRDFGPGVALHERSRIFQPFYRVSSRLTDGVAGTGIGLDIARQLARQHGGDVTLLDVPSGACFRVCISTPAPEHGA